jgi:hypothetical protein
MQGQRREPVHYFFELKLDVIGEQVGEFAYPFKRIRREANAPHIHQATY